jgi:hypothetical protein
MEVAATATFGLLVWIVLWALGVSGFDALLIGIGLFLIAIAIQNVVPRLGSSNEK